MRIARRASRQKWQIVWWWEWPPWPVYAHGWWPSTWDDPMFEWWYFGIIEIRKWRADLIQ